MYVITAHQRHRQTDRQTDVKRSHDRYIAKACSGKNRSNLAKGGIAVANPPNSSFVFARWQHRTDGLGAICNCKFDSRFNPSHLPFPLGSGARM